MLCVNVNQPSQSTFNGLDGAASLFEPTDGSLVRGIDVGAYDECELTARFELDFKQSDIEAECWSAVSSSFPCSTLCIDFDIDIPSG